MIRKILKDNEEGCQVDRRTSVLDVDIQVDVDNVRESVCHNEFLLESFLLHRMFRRGSQHKLKLGLRVSIWVKKNKNKIQPRCPYRIQVAT